jgi:hypothetical protein
MAGLSKKKMLRVFKGTILFSFVLLLPSSAHSWPTIRPLVNTLQIEDVSRARIRALMDRDESSFAKYYAPNFEETTAWGTIEDISYLMRWIKTAPPGFTLKPSNYHVTVSTDGTMAYSTFQIEEEYPDPVGGKTTRITSQFSYQSKPFG